jgi:hypothetical protein
LLSVTFPPISGHDWQVSCYDRPLLRSENARQGVDASSGAPPRGSSSVRTAGNSAAATAVSGGSAASGSAKDAASSHCGTSNRTVSSSSPVSIAERSTSPSCRRNPPSSPIVTITPATARSFSL